MSWLAGVDGCPKGWFRICRETRSGRLRFEVFERAESLIEAPPNPRIVGLDIPIGLPASGPRACDRAARSLLGPRRSSVFPAPIRPVLGARSRAEADRIGRRVDGRGVSAQAFNLFAKIAAVDELLAASLAARRALVEVHPELSFRAWNDARPMAFAKKHRQGRAERLALAEAWLGPALIERARGDVAKRDLADDDILDAVAALWTAHRIATGRAETLPAEPDPLDAEGRPMRIVY
jgi:predicted RNase H-like nuclease